MMEIKPPEGSQIKTRTESGGVVIEISPPRLSDSALGTILFLLVWLCFWAAGWSHAASTLWSGKGGVFLIFWLTFWTIGGCWAAVMLYRLIRKPEPERLTLERGGVRYDSGLPRPNVGFFRPWSQTWAETFPRRLRAEFDRTALRSLRLRETDGGNRLTLDLTTRRIDIGKNASEVEREWLLHSLRAYYRLAEDGQAGT